MHHKRVVQEKNKLIVDLKRLKNHYSNFEPMLQMMRAKYETAMKEKMLMKLERDRLASRVGALEAQLRQLDSGRAVEEGGDEQSAAPKKPRGAKLPPDARDNPHIERTYVTPQLNRWGLSKTVQAHSAAVSSVALHPSKPIVATAGDDSVWKLWSLEAGTPRRLCRLRWPWLCGWRVRTSVPPPRVRSASSSEGAPAPPLQVS